MSTVIDRVLTRLGIQPVLVDIGASGSPPTIWEPIAPYAIYVGFDPDQRELHDIPDGQFARSIIVNKAVINTPDQNKVHFYLTHSPFCSSTLPPDTKSLENYLFSDLFVVEKETSVPASTLTAVLNRLGLSGIDWFKSDSQGTDLRLFQSLPEGLRSEVLAVYIEPGLIDAYQGEDLFIDAHRELTRQGFWLSNLNIGNAIRMQRSTLSELDANAAHLIEQFQRPSPAWCEARYLRSLEWLAEHRASESRYILLWVFALIDEQYGFALDIARFYNQNFVGGAWGDTLKTAPLQLLEEKKAEEQLTTGRTKRVLSRLARLARYW